MNFIQMCLSGEALEDEIDEFVERWHEGDEGLGLELHEYLGMTWDEYKLWGATPSALRFILAAHAENKTLDAVLQPEKYA
ncbi:MAG: hypothetical protein JWP52_3087, partial [Rhizobacter sp.]|nr:hypothetical protein [Rhizobacter sp.]